MPAAPDGAGTGRRRMSEAERELAGSVYFLALRIAGTWAAGRPQSRDDIVSAAMLGACKAAMEYDPARGVAFSTFAYICINSTLKSHLSRAVGRRHVLLSEIEGDGIAGPFEVADPRAVDPRAILESADIAAGLARALAGLPERERFILARRAEGMDQEGIARELARHEGRDHPITKQAISAIEARGLKRLQDSLGARGIHRKPHQRGMGHATKRETARAG